MIISRSWTMTITEMLRSSVIVILTLASCVAGAPLQLEAENIGLGQAVYSQPELAAALVRSYEALESQEINGESDISTRNLDHIGGGNLLRNLDDSDGENLLLLLREAATGRRDNEFERNLDHIGGGNLLRNLDSQISVRSRSLVRDEQGNPKGVTTNRPDGLEASQLESSRRRAARSSQSIRNIVRRRDTSGLNELVERNLDRIGGGNLLRNLDSQTFGKSNPVGEDVRANESERTDDGGRGRFTGGFKEAPSKWPSTRGNWNSLGGGNSLSARPRNYTSRGSSEFPFKRNLDRIGGGNLLRDLAAGDEFERNIDRIARKNLLRDFDSQRFATLDQ